MDDFDNKYREILGDGKGSQFLSSGCCFKVVLLLLSASFLFVRMEIPGALPIQSLFRTPSSFSDAEADVEKKPAGYLFALPVKSAGLENMTHGYSHSLDAPPLPDANAWNHAGKEEAPTMLLFALPLKDSYHRTLGDKLSRRTLQTGSRQSIDLDQATLGKNGHADQPRPKDDLFQGIKDALKNLAASAAATSWGEVVTIPFDTIKVRMQTEGAAAAGAVQKYNGLRGTAMTIAKEEGIGAFWKGLTPGIHHQVLFGGMRFGFYEPVRDMFTKIICGQNHTESTPFAVKLLSGLTTGAVAILIASPTDLVKVRMQAQKLVEGVAPKYPNALAAYRIILMEEGLAGIWNGVSPNILRSTIVSAVELGTYDHVKEELLKFGMQESPLVHVVAAFVTGFAAVIATNPADVLKSRLMSDTKGAYRGLRDCAWKTMAKDGPLAFYKGFSPSFARSASWCVVSFMTLEQIKELTGIKKKELEPSPEPELMIQPQELEPSPEPAQDPEPEHMIQPSPEPERRKMLNASV